MNGVCKCAGEKGVTEVEAVQMGMEEKSREPRESFGKCGEVDAKTRNAINSHP